MATEVFANDPSTTISSGGTTAPASGTTETWTGASWASFPVAATGATQFHVYDTAAGYGSELILVRNISGTTASVTRGAEGTTPVAHVTGFTVTQPITAGFLGNLVQCASIVSFGADPTGAADSTAAIQAAWENGLPVYAPAGNYLVGTGGVSLIWQPGLVFFGPYAGTFPGLDTIPGIAYLHRVASTNADVIQVPDGTNYGRMSDIAIDGNKTHNTAGYGINLQDGAALQETEIHFTRCFIHDNPYSNFYLGNFRLANRLRDCTIMYSATGDGITVAGTDNMISGNIIGDNGRCGIAVGTTISQNYAASGTAWDPADTQIYGNNIFKNDTGIAISSGVDNTVLAMNIINLNNRQGITVYDQTCNTIHANMLHGNSQATNNGYAHIDVGASVTGVSISDNMFGAPDAGTTNVASWCVNVGSGASPGTISGNLGTMNATSSVNGLINQAGSNASPSIIFPSMIVKATSSSQKVFQLESTTGSVLFSLTNGGSFTLPNGAGQFETAQNVFGSATALASAVVSLVGTATGTAQLKTQLFAGQTADIADFYASNGSTLLAKITAAGVYVGPQAASVSYTPSNPTATASGTLVMMGLGTTCTFTPGATGIVMATVNGFWNTATASINGTLSARYGTGTAPANAAAVTGTRWGTGTSDPSINAARSQSGAVPFSFTQVITGLTVATAYWFDLATSTSNPSDSATVTNVTMSFTELPA